MRRVAVIGGGIAGLAAARRLAPHARVTLVEARPELGGHVRTVQVESQRGQNVALDCGFIVFNRSRYPGFTRMLKELGVESQRSEMSFGVSAADGSFAYSTRTPRSLFAQTRSLADRKHIKMVADMFRFLGRARKDSRNGEIAGLDLGAYLDRIGASTEIRERFVYPLAGSLWSAGRREASEFPAEVFIGFLSAHGMLRPAFAPPWRTVTGGSATYVNALRRALEIDWRVGDGAVSIERGRPCRIRLASGAVVIADRVVVATHADRALALLDEPTREENEALGAIQYTDNEVVVHRDEAVLPKERSARAAWNYRVTSDGKVEATYWCNKLQRIAGPTNYFVTLNSRTPIRDSSILYTDSMRHPCFDLDCLKARRRLSRIQGQQFTYFAGAYFGYGFHEDGFRSGTAAASSLLADLASVRQARIAA